MTFQFPFLYVINLICWLATEKWCPALEAAGAVKPAEGLKKTTVMANIRLTIKAEAMGKYFIMLSLALGQLIHQCVCKKHTVKE
jgi:hypothetical protein